jgi:aminoglycoside/choline kinase family phosphotransferase
MQKVKEYLATTAYKEYEITLASADASFRKYYRLTNKKQTRILMDSSLEKESLAPFLAVTKKLQDAGVNVPHIYEQNLSLGYLIMEDFGNTLLLNVLDNNNYKEFYKKAIDSLVKMQNADTAELPLYDKKFLHFEMNLMQEWYLEKKLSLRLTQEQKQILTQALEQISNVVLSQPQGVFVHRDYHSRNIMLKDDNSLGIIDYQDAMNGALTYDLVSLLKDCYIAFDRESVVELVLYFKKQINSSASDASFIKWFDFMGMQRHIKVLGVFSRLHLRDGKEGYLKDIPLTLKYTLQTAKMYEETKEFAAFLEACSQ